MKPHTKAAAVSAVKWAAALSALFVLVHLVVGLAMGSGIDGMAKKLAVAIFWFPIIFIGLWLYGIFSKR